MTSGTALVELFEHADCCLCATALAELERLAPELGFAIVQRDITADPILHRAYFERVPVITLDGVELCEFFLDEALLRARLADPPGG